jgi:hypothetical protein
MFAMQSRYLALGLFAAASVVFPALAQERPSSDLTRRPADWLEERTQELASYRFEAERDPPHVLKMEPRSILNWSNPERGTYAGAVFLWTHEGRPELIACAYGRDQWLRHEFHSLSSDAITAERGGGKVHRFKPGIAWRDLTDAPPPAATAALRLAQMRKQAERFRVTIVVQPPGGSKQPAETRMLTQPVYRWQSAAGEEVALFLFVQGTDPECVLMLEATSDKTWRYALTRQTRAAVEAELDGKRVLDVPVFWQLPPDPESAFVELIPPEAKPRQPATP